MLEVITWGFWKAINKSPMCKIVQSQYTFGRDGLKWAKELKERLGSLSVFSRLRIQVSHGSIIAFAALIMILFVAFTVRILPLRWENLSGGTALLNEFDPYYQFSITQHMVQNGLLSPYWPTHWINTQKWYPDGLDMSTALASTAHDSRCSTLPN